MSFPERTHPNRNMVTIYSLLCPDTLIIKYIGKTDIDIKKRYANHLNSKEKSKKAKWIKQLLIENKKPIFAVLEIVERKKWKAKEIEYIEKYSGINLLNELKGGGGGISKVDRVNSLKKFQDFLLKSKYSNTTKKNYYSYVNKTLKYFGLSDCKKITGKELELFLNSIPNKNTRNIYLVSLKIYFKEIHNQPKKLSHIHYEYS